MMDCPNPQEASPEESEDFRTFSARAEGTNINPQTLLATDYLNHFNEIVMMLEMIPDIPECLEEAQAWQPKSYQDHFRDSQFRDKELAVECYDHVPPRFRGPFEHVISEMNALVAAALLRIAAAVEGGNQGEVQMLCSDSSRAVQKMMDVASAIIHGSERRFDQTEIDGILGR